MRSRLQQLCSKVMGAMSKSESAGPPADSLGTAKDDTAGAETILARTFNSPRLAAIRFSLTMATRKGWKLKLILSTTCPVPRTLELSAACSQRTSQTHRKYSRNLSTRIPRWERATVLERPRIVHADNGISGTCHDGVLIHRNTRDAFSEAMRNGSAGTTLFCAPACRSTICRTDNVLTSKNCDRLDSVSISSPRS
jgi:hypothetical protein